MSSKKGHIKFIEKYKTEQKSDRNKTLLKLFIALSLLISIGFIAYYKWIDELKFIGKETTFLNAKIINENRIHIGEGLYIQTGKCEFEFEKKEYITDFKTKNWRNITNSKEFEIGDIIKLKNSTKNPLISKFIQ